MPTKPSQPTPADISPDKAVHLIRKLMQRFKGVTFEMLEQVLLPLDAPITKLDRTLKKFGMHYGATFEIAQGTEHPTITRGRSGKIVPKAFLEGTGDWKELLKARIHDAKPGQANGELHYTGQKKELETRIVGVNVGDVFEIDRYGITAKLESALTEAALVEHALKRGYKVTRLPEDIAQHLGEYHDCDFIFEKNGVKKKVESKSLWGTDTSKCRLIHSVGGRYETSSCKFAAQDFFAVNLWLRTGCITDIAFARSVLRDAKHPHGLPAASKKQPKKPKDAPKRPKGTPAPPKELLPDYVTQNPDCSVDNVVWFGSIDDVWNLP